MKLERSVFGLLERSARMAHGDDDAVGFEGEILTFRQLHARSVTLAGGLWAQGVRKGDRVAVMMGNRLEWVEVFFGLAAIGAVCVPVNVLLTAQETAHVCEDSGAEFLVMDEIGAKVAGTLRHPFRLVVTVGEARAPAGSPAMSYDDLVASSPAGFAPVAPDLDDTFILYYSSGTTGLPKAAEHTHDGVLWNAFGQVDGLRLTRRVRYAVVPSLSWAAGFHNLFIALVWVGGYSEIRRTGGTTADKLVDLLVRERITHTFLVPSLLRELPGRPDLCARLEESDLEWVLTGSEPVPRAVVEACVTAMPSVAVSQGYGLSEFPTIVTVMNQSELAAHDGSAGRALAICDLAVQDALGTISDVGEGELLIRSPATMRGYFGRPDLTEEAFRGGWLHTGDLVELDAEGYVTIVGRTKDMIISGGLNVYPKEVEDVLHRIPGVREVAVVGVPDQRFGETPVAVVVSDQPGFDTAPLAAACLEQLASYKRPRHFLVREEPLPRNANMKILKRELRPWALAELELAP
jgi:fatty-acyl-CoA synthase